MSDGLKLISKLLQDGGLPALRELDPEVFIGDEVGAYQFVRTHVHNYGRLPDIATLEDRVGIELPEAVEDIRYYIQRVTDRKTYNDVRAPFRDLRNALADNDIPTARSAIERLRAISRVSGVQHDLRTIHQVGTSVMRGMEISLDQSLEGGMAGIPTGWTLLDRELDGYQPGDLVTWVARPGMGKTYYLLFSAMAAFNAGFRVLFVSMEMTLDQLGRRLFGILSGVNPKLIRKGRVSRRGQRTIQDVLSLMEGDADRFHLYAGNFRKNVEDVETLMQDINPDIVFIDGVYIMKTAVPSKGGRYDMALEVFDYLKQMTITHNLPIIVTTKFGRGAGKKGGDGSLETIGFTDAVGSNSSLVFSLKPGNAPNEDTQRVIEVLKGREGEEGTFILNFNFRPMDFSAVTGGLNGSQDGTQTDDEEIDGDGFVGQGDRELNAGWTG